MSRKAEMVVVVDAQREAMAMACGLPLPGGRQEEAIELLDWKAIS